MYCKSLCISPGLIEICKCILVDFIKCRGSIYALTMFFLYPNYTHRITRNLMLIFGELFGLIYRGPIFRKRLYPGAFLRDFTVFDRLFFSSLDLSQNLTPSAPQKKLPIYFPKCCFIFNSSYSF